MEKEVKEQKFEFQVLCVPHGWLGTVAQATLGIALFNAHHAEVKGCMEAIIRPVINKNEQGSPNTAKH